MTYFQKLVSGKRRRFIEEDWNLDLSYITDRVIGMSFPASTFGEKIYRNDIDKVAAFFNQKHTNTYQIYNMSNRGIQEQRFGKAKVISYSWADHHSPAISVLFDSCDHMFRYLKENPKRVVTVNCNAGKGRTGTSISCFLIYSGLAGDDWKTAMNYYGNERFWTGRGVSQPSQQRYVQYFALAHKRFI